MEEKKVLFETEGFKVYADSIYTLTDKEDLSAASGFVEGGFTKLPSAGVNDVFQARAVKVGVNKYLWDTGFYLNSPCYRTTDPEKVKIIVNQLNKNIVEPYEKSASSPGVLSQENDAFYNTEFFNVSRKKIFNTSQPKEVLELYFALKTRRVVPENKIGDMKYKRANFVVSNFEKAQEFKNIKLSLNSRATGMFEMLLLKDKATLFSILSYINIPFSNKVNDDTLRGMFQHFLASKNGTANVSVFLEACTQIDTEEGREKIIVYTNLKEIGKNSNIFTKEKGGKYFYKGTEVGPDLRTSAENIVSRKELSKIKDEIILNEDSEINEY